MLVPYSLDIHSKGRSIYTKKRVLEIGRVDGWRNLYIGTHDDLGQKEKVVFSIELDVPFPPPTPPAVVIDPDPPVKHERISDEDVRKRQELFSNWVCDFRQLLGDKKLSDCSLVVCTYLQSSIAFADIPLCF